MSDFTKDELEDLKSTILGMRGYTQIENWDEELLNKIDSMIINYDNNSINYMAIMEVFAWINGLTKNKKYAKN
jgi:hypothetical protein